MPVADSPVSINDDKRLFFNTISDLAYIKQCSWHKFDRLTQTISLWLLA